MDSEFVVYTSSFYSLDRIPDNYERVSIAIGSPKFFNGRKLECFMPTWDLVNRYKSGLVTKEDYLDEYLKILESRKESVLSSIEELKNKNVVLLCHEPPGKFCHRQVVSLILNKFGVRSYEF